MSENNVNNNDNMENTLENTTENMQKAVSEEVKPAQSGGIIEMLKRMKKEDKIILASVAAIIVIIAGVWMIGGMSSNAEDKHQAELRAEANVPECVHIKEAQAQLFKTKAQLKEKITSGFDEYWNTYEKNFWVEFRKSHIKNYPNCFAAQNDY